MKTLSGGGHFCDLSGRTAIVTGGGTGIGKAISVQLARAGADIILASRDPSHLGMAAQEISEIGRKCLTIQADVGNPDQVQNLIHTTLKEMGRIDILVNNAGGNFTPDGRPPAKRIEDVAEEEWDFIVDTNLKSVFLVSRAVVPSMKEKHYGRIITISSLVGRVGIPFITLPYGTAKAGVIGFTRILAHQLGPFGITVNTVAPGYILSGPRIEELWEERKKAGIKDQVIDSIAVKRLGKPEDVTGAVVFLASEEAAYITGSTIDVFGGAYTL
jgi:NAD(P)-dependent dehydrogenase (short-subunit alcohol dehydrogenase family)